MLIKALDPNVILSSVQTMSQSHPHSCSDLGLKHRRTREEVRIDLAEDYDSQPWHFFAGFCFVSTHRFIAPLLALS